jgi:hypothetical protein
MATRPYLFISYRRSDAAGHAGRLRDALERTLGADSVFRDVEAIGAGSNYLDTIHRGLHAATHVLVVIGPDWLAAAKGGAPRLFDEDDVVRSEIRLVLKLGKPVIPVLTGAAAMPRADQLPADLAWLALRTALELSESRWDFDIDRILAAVGSQARTAERPGLPWCAIAGLLVVAAAVMLDSGSAYGLRGGARMFLGGLAAALGLVDPVLRRAGPVRWRGLGWACCALGLGLALCR